MVPLILVFCLASALGESPEEESWAALRSELPPEVAAEAERSGLSVKNVFQNTVVLKLHEQVRLDSESILARQKILEEYVACSCPACPEGDHLGDRAGNSTDTARKEKQIQLVPFTFGGAFHAITHPRETVKEFLTRCDTKLTITVVKTLRATLRLLQIRNNELTRLVTCNCPSADKCRRMLDPLIFSIVTGANDTELNRAYWKQNLQEVHQTVPKGLMDRLTDAAAAVLSYFYNRDRPAAEQHQNLSAPIFAPGVDPTSWTNPQHEKRCPDILVNVSNHSTFLNSETTSPSTV